MPRQRQRRPAAQADRPVSVKEAEQLFGSFKRFRHVALAVSGGSDLTALMWLAARLVRDSGVPKLSVLTVDHGLRAGSSQESAQVAVWARALGLEAHVLDWLGPKPASGIQPAARKARYDLMTAWCEEHGAEILVTAHTLDDQAETLLMRLARGSGVAGLASIPRRGQSERGILIVRPLLAVPRSRLRATLGQAAQAWIDDPSNEDIRFERVRLRKAMPELAKLGLSIGALGLSAARSERAASALLHLASDLLRRSAELHREGYALIRRDIFGAAEDELRILALQQLLEVLGGNVEPPRLLAVERLDHWLSAGEGAARTLAGCRIARQSTSILIGREPGRIGAEPVALGRARVVWDNRFAVEWRKEPILASIVAAGHIRDLKRSARLPAFVQAGLPAIVANGKLLAVPHLDGETGKFASHFLAKKLGPLLDQDPAACL